MVFLRLVLASMGSFLSVLATSSELLAQTVDIPFSASVASQVTFDLVEPGVATPPTTVTSDGLQGSFQSTNPARISVQANEGGTIIISEPFLTSGPTPDPPGTERVGVLRFGATEVRSNVGGGAAVLPPGDTDLEVELYVERPDPFPAGTYKYVVNLTITP